jgi:hypothetical protein
MGHPQAQGEAAVNPQGAAGDVVGIVAGQKDGGPTNIALRTQATPGQLAGSGLNLLLGGKLSLTGRVNPTGVGKTDAAKSSA